MTYFEDMTPYTYGRGVPGVRMVNIGWLDIGKPYPTGNTPEGFLKALSSVCRTYRAHQTRGFHSCPWCATEDRSKAPRSSSEVHVPGHGLFYAAPQMIGHYVADHHYLPPPEFVEAVMWNAAQGPPSS